MKFLFIMFFFLINLVHAQNESPKVKYEYKKYEKFDFDEIGVEGESGAPGDISISPRLRKEFQNKLPERKNFDDEMVLSINGVR